jgi:HK97 family phage major capsid protein
MRYPDLLQHQRAHRAKELLTDLLNGWQPETRAEEVRSAGGFLDLPSRDLKSYSLLRAIKLKLDSIMSTATRLGLDRRSCDPFSGVEAEAHEELCTRFGVPVHQGRFYVPADYLYRDLTVAAPSGGGYLVGTSNISFIDMLRNFSAAFRLGVQRLPGMRDNVTLPRQTGASTVTWLTTEGTQATESAAVFDQVTGSPNTAAAYSEISRQLLKQSDPSAELVVSRGLAADVATAADLAVFAGTGTEQPQGIIGTAGVGAISGTTLGYTGLVQAQTDIANANAVVDPTTLGYVTTPTIAQLLKGRQRFTGTDSPLWVGAVHAGEIEGVTAVSTKQIPTAKMLYGDFSQCAVAEWGVLQVEVNPFTDFKAGIVGVRCMYSLDVIVLHPAAFTVFATIT